ncbi:hypothetical protein [Acidipropionibacterium virtanenii]|uniref:Uncharacterized protein n=1 Tax=Acidipropionibacterium virtanenii TaxID=2057246 RepID=A0A344UY73_9ACTN|nr:hypothetical protein [Acidipropionibacterium virtanenii]AXE40221.1 hypothetical protein JS278_03087 [Acidipropionibacterium virtanenii]
MTQHQDGIVDVLDVVVGRVLAEIAAVDTDPGIRPDAFIRERYRGSRVSAGGGEVVRLELASGVVATILVRGLRMDMVIEVRGRRADLEVPQGRFADALLRFVS